MRCIPIYSIICLPKMISIQSFIIVVCVCVGASTSPAFIANALQPTYKYYTRAEWVAQPSNGSIPLLSLPVPYVVIHHTYIPAACNTTTKCAASMRSMQRYHQSLGWSDIGYNFCVGSEASVYEGRGWDHKGVHAGRANSHSIGICLIGDWRVNLPPKEQLDATKVLIATGARIGKISSDYKIIGHNQAMNTECPGSALFREISTWDHFFPGHPDFNLITTTELNKI